MDPHPSIDVIGAPPTRFNLASYVLAKVAETPEKTALKVVGAETEQTWTFSKLDLAVRRTARGLIEQGLRPGDKVLMRLGNTPDFPIVFLGAIHAGLTPIPTSAQLTAPEITAIARETAPQLVVADAGVSRPSQPIRTLDQTSLWGFAELSPLEPVLGDPNRPAYIIYTSGTSGKPRPVVHAHRAVWARRMMWDGWYGLRAEDVMLHAGAFNWTYTLGTGLLDPWAIGATSLIPADGTSADQLPNLLADHKASIFAAAPGVYRRILRSQVHRYAALRLGVSAGEKLPTATAKAWEDATGTPVHEAYGMSECSTFISTRPGHPSIGLGWPQPGRKVSLRGKNGPVATGQTGQIAIHKDDPGLMLGYFNAPAETANRYDGDWFMTGDLGHNGPDGAIHYDGRADDMMNAGGYRVSPIEVEDVLTRHPDISEVAASEITVAPDTTVIAAFYVSPDVLDDAELSTFAAQFLARYKVPRKFVRLDRLPRGANHKIQRQSLRRNWEKTHGQT